jgi:hypothetical protein
VLKPGQRHIYKRRTFYVDEDSWQIVAVDCYDGRDQLWRVQEGHSVNYYDVPTFWSTMETTYDLQSGRYLALGFDNEEPMTVDFNLKRTHGRLHAVRHRAPRHALRPAPEGLAERGPAGRSRRPVCEGGEDMSRRGFAALAAPLLALPGHALASTRPADSPPSRRGSRRWRKSLLLDLARAGPRVFAVGERGHVLYSTDEGRTWTQVQVPASANLTAVYFVDERHGWAVGHDEVILRTTDGGIPGSCTRFEPDTKQPLLDVWFADPTAAWRSAPMAPSTPDDDGGATGSPRHSSRWASPRGACRRTTRRVRGRRRCRHRLPPERDRARSGRPAVPGCGGRPPVPLGRRGATWYELPSPYDGSFYGILPLDGDALLAFGLRGNVFRSEDGGKNWTGDRPAPCAAALRQACAPEWW